MRPLRRAVLQFHFLPFRAAKSTYRIERQIQQKHKHLGAFVQDPELEDEIALGEIEVEFDVAVNWREHQQCLFKHSGIRHRRAHHTRQNRVRLQDDLAILEKRVDSCNGVKDVANELDAVVARRESRARLRCTLEVTQERLELGGGGVLEVIHRREGQEKVEGRSTDQR